MNTATNESNPNVRDNTGSLWPNQKGHAGHPDFKGSLVIGGVEYWVSAWNKMGSSGPFMSLAFDVKATQSRGR